MRLAMPGYLSTSSPMRKKVALTFFAFSTSRILGVHVGSGPSSKVIATFFCEVPPYMSTSYGEGMVLKTSSLTRLVFGSTVIVRSPEAGREAILRVNGFSKHQIAGMIFGESALVSIFGAFAGLLVGTCFLYTLKSIPALHGYIDTTIEPLILLIVILLALLTGVAGAFYPAIYAMRIRAVEALRFE